MKDSIRPKVLAGLIAGSILALGCGEAGDVSGPAGIGPVWLQPFSHRGIERPLRADADHVYVSVTGGVTALDRSTGEAVWQSAGAPGLVGWPYVVTGNAVAVAMDDMLIGLRPSDGSLLWQHADAPVAMLGVDEPDGLFATDGVQVLSYDPASGVRLWSAPLGPGGDVNLAAGSGQVCAERLVSPPADSRITCYDRVSGEELWTRFVRGLRWIAVAGPFVVADLGAVEGTGWAGIDAETGETIWEDPSLTGDHPALSPQANVLYTCATECLAVHAEDGVVFWRTSLNEDMGVPTADESSVYVVGSERDGRGALYVLDSANGAIRERIVPGSSEGGGFCGTPAVSGDMLFVFGCSENLHAYIWPGH